MSILNNQSVNPFLLSSKSFQLAIKNSHRGTSITMSLLTNYFHTNSLPQTQLILEELLPQVLKTKCYNDSNLPFHVEVRNTEIGHLFEHILLEYLCQEKIANGHKKASFRGVTDWDWKEDVKGTFHIKIDMGPEDVVFFEYSLNKSIKLMDKIMRSSRTNTSIN